MTHKVREFCSDTAGTRCDEARHNELRWNEDLMAWVIVLPRNLKPLVVHGCPWCLSRLYWAPPSRFREASQIPAQRITDEFDEPDDP